VGKRDLAGTVLDGRYRLVEPLAEGAMGAVYRGVSLSVDRAVAIKVMHTSLPGEMAARERFQREAKLMALVDHPHCISVIDYGLHEGRPYLVMDLVRGRSLYALLAEQQQVESARAVDIMQQVLSGLAYAHEQGIIHRDIKPANIMVTPKAPLGLHVRILDFGLARLRESSTSLTGGLAVGTPSYMAPEQCRGDTVDARVDIYACGIVLFELLAGRKPFVSSDLLEVVKQQMHATPPRLADIAGGDFGALEDVVARALAKSPTDRFPTAIAMSEALDAAALGRATPEATAAFAEVVDSNATGSRSSEEPITLGSSVVDGSREPSRLSRLLPRSRMRIVAAVATVVLATGAYAIWRATDRRTSETVVAVPRDAAAIAVAPLPGDAATDPTAEIRTTVDALVATGRNEAAIALVVKARREYPDRAVLPYLAGRLYFAKLWWADGVAAFRDAIRLDPSYRNDPEMIRTVIRGFVTTPEYDWRIGNFLAELGDAAEPALDDTAHNHPNPQVRARAAAQLRRTTR
jgi:serine/threonine protein kinase